MSIIDTVLRHNAEYARQFALGHLHSPPARRLAVLTCMDARIEVESMLGLNTGDVQVIRNAGGLATDDALRSLILSHHIQRTQEFMVIGHTDCGMLTFQDDELRSRLRGKTGRDADTPAHFHAFSDLEQSVRNQVLKIRSHPWIPAEVVVRGFVYNVKSGQLAEVNSY